MPNPYLPSWEYIPDGEPRVFGDRVYIYGSHDRAASDDFCDYKLKVWSAPVSHPGNWICHGDIFHTRTDRDHVSDTDWSDKKLFSPDVVCKDGKYYLYAYVTQSEGCVAVADRPEGPFKLINRYQFEDTDEAKRITVDGQFIDPGVLVDDDGRVFVYCGFTRSFIAEINPDNMYEVIDGTISEDVIPPLKDGMEHTFFEAASPRKVGGTYYFIYSPQKGSRLAYATSDSPTGPFTYQGYIVDNSQDYPGGNDHGSICKIGDQWYIFYHRMTNGTIMSRRGCVEKIEILPDGTIPPVEMTSLGFEDSLNPYQIHRGEIACVLTGGCLVTEQNVFERMVTNITDGCVLGYKYFDFGDISNARTMRFAAKVQGAGCNSEVSIYLDDPKNGELIGVCKVGTNGGLVSTVVSNVTGRHALYFVVKQDISGPFVGMFEGRNLFNLEEFVFLK